MPTGGAREASRKAKAGLLLRRGCVAAPVRQVLRQLRVGHLRVLVVGVGVDVGAVRRDCAQLDHERETVRREVLLRLLVVVQRAVRAARPVPLAPPRADVAVGEVEPEVLAHARLLAHPRRRVGRDLLVRRQLHQLLCVLRGQSLRLPRDSALLPLLHRADVRDDRLAARRHKLGELLARERHALPRRHQHQRSLGRLVVLRAVDAEAAVDAERHFGRRGVGCVALGPQRAALLQVHVQRLAAPHRRRLHVLRSKAEVGAQRDVKAARRERAVEAEHALVVVHLVVLGGRHQAAHARTDTIEERLHKHTPGCMAMMRSRFSFTQ